MNQDRMQGALEAVLFAAGEPLSVAELAQVMQLEKPQVWELLTSLQQCYEAETRGLLLYSAGVAAGRITKEQMCALLAENPAKLYGAYPRKGVLQAGSDADIVVYDPEADMTITAENQHSAADYTPFEGFRTHGSIAQVWLRGQLAVEHGELRIGAVGEYIPRHPGAL